MTVTAWASSFVVIRAAGHWLSPGALALGRVLVSTAILSAVAMARREPLPTRGHLARIAAYGVLWQGVYSVALNAAERRADAGTAAMFIGSGPLLIAVFAGIFLREGFPRRLFAGCVVAFVGSVLIGFATAQGGSNAGFGMVLLGVASVAYASAIVIQKSVVARVSALQITWLGSLAAAIVLLPFAPQLAQEMQSTGASAFAWIGYLGIVPTTLGFALWSYALRRTSAGRMAILLYLIPPVAAALGWALLSEMPPWPALAGGALCLGGVYLAQQPSKENKP
jgi:drug/metabolite transporter (DMT)-like permease